MRTQEFVVRKETLDDVVGLLGKKRTAADAGVAGRDQCLPAGGTEKSLAGLAGNGGDQDALAVDAEDLVFEGLVGLQRDQSLQFATREHLSLDQRQFSSPRPIFAQVEIDF